MQAVRLFGLVALCVLAATSHAQVPQLINYQGRVAVGSTNFNGSGQFKFALVNANGTTTYWSNSAMSGGQPSTAVPLTVTNGLYSVLLGDSTMTNMAVIPASVFTNSDVRLRVWFNDGVNGTVQLSPDQRIAAVGYAMMANNVVDGAISSAKIATGAVGTAQLATGAVDTAQLAAGAVTSTKLATNAVETTHIGSGAVSTSALQAGAVTLDRLATAQVPRLLRTINNPAPGSDDWFGMEVAVVGGFRIVVGGVRDESGEYGSGTAHLFDFAGKLLHTFSDPTPGDQGFFGTALAAVGSNRVLIGAYGDNTGAPNAGGAYLFDLAGTLLRTFNNPTPEDSDSFGAAVAAVGSDRVLIGAYADNTGAPNAGSAYLFDLNGTLLRTFNNPAPADGDQFGGALTAVGADKVLISATGDDTGASSAGTAYLFDLNGTLLRTFNNPSPAAFDAFGAAVAAIGADKVLIAASGDDTGANGAGIAYLFDLNGNLLRTFNNPTPAASDSFGRSVAAFGTTKVLISAPGDDTGANSAGTAYLFDVDGTILRTFHNPDPDSSDEFGGAIAAAGTSSVLIGAYSDNAGASDAGSAYLLDTTATNTQVSGLTAETVGAGAVSTEGLAFAAVTGDKIANDSITAAKLEASFAADLAHLSGAQTFSGANIFSNAGNAFTGNGSALSSLNASNLSSGTVADGRLGSNVARRSGGNALTGTQTITSGNLGVGTVAPGALVDVATSSSKSLQIRHDSGLVPGINLGGTGGNVGVMRLRNAMEIWPSDDAARSGRLDVRNTGGAATIALEGSSGQVSAVSFNTTSDRAAKENFASVDPREVLEKLTELPLSQWNFKHQPEVRHIGPMAQDFHDAFGVGPDDRHIATVDADGVALAAIQGLYLEMQAENQRMRREHDALQKRLERLEQLRSKFDPSSAQ